MSNARGHDKLSDDLKELDSWIAEVYSLQPRRVISTPTARAILQRDGSAAVAMIRAYVTKLEVLQKQRTSHEFMQRLADQLLKRDLPFSDDDLVWLAQRAAKTEDFWEWPLVGITTVIERHVARHGMSEKLRIALGQMRKNIEKRASHKAERDLVGQLNKLAGECVASFTADVGEPWAKRLQNDIAGMTPALRETWTGLLAHAQNCTASRPAPQWLEDARRHIAAVGADEFFRRTSDWFAVFGRLRTDKLPTELQAEAANDPEIEKMWRYDVSVPNGLLLKGLIWMCRAAADPRHKPVLESLMKGCLAVTPYGKRFAEGATACRRALEQLGLGR